MDRLWARRRPVTCTHPDWRMLVGRRAVMKGWRLILLDHRPPEIWPVAAQAIVTGSTAMVICTERVDGAELMAANSFVREGARWRLLNHQSMAAGKLAEP
ncbi:MAG TPA: nuclear transport factor 2 family protein [Paracoccaceae bacterium]|nr:nuclear transport factor 2 family protein [Paracoccaceae bacterium]